MTDEVKRRLERCDREIAEIPELYPNGGIFNIGGELDWMWEKEIIVSQHLENRRTTQIVLEGLVADAIRTEPDYGAAIRRLQDERTVRLLHVAMGMASEAGEFVDQMKRAIYYGNPIDTVNLIEEIGDSTWYERIAVDELEVTFLEMLQRNVDKLKKRFPDKSSEERAINRDLDGERKILEGGDR